MMLLGCILIGVLCGALFMGPDLIGIGSGALMGIVVYYFGVCCNRGRRVGDRYWSEEKFRQQRVSNLVIITLLIILGFLVAGAWGLVLP